MITRVVLTVTLVLVLCRTTVAQERCSTCHPDVRIEHQQGAHAKRLGCADCHGGDPDSLEMEEAHAVARGYRGRPERKQIPSLCATCHADPERMRGVGLSTDQLAQYEASGHGRRLAEGDMRTAVCTDCHGTHRILSRREPTSPVHPNNVPDTCGRCHSDQELMSAYGFPADQVEKFRSSVHGVALLIDRHPSAPTCATCHGAHGAVAPHVGSISAVCGHCHVRTREYFNDGPHAKATAEQQMSECISCHGYHDTVHPDRALFDEACGTCHAADSHAMAVGQKLKTVLSRSEEALESSGDALRRAERHFPSVARYRPRLQQARAYFLEALPVQHSLALERVEDLTRSARSVGEEIQASIHGVEQESSWRYVALALVWMFIVFTVSIAYLYRRDRRSELARQRSDAVDG